MACKVPKCKNVKRLINPESGVTFHRFPKGERFKIFKEKIGLPNLQWGPRIYICSDHFLDTDFYPGEKHILKNVATPSRNLTEIEVCEASSSTSCALKRKDNLPLDESDSKMLRTRAITPSSTATLSSPERKLPSSSSPTISSITSSPHQEKETFRKPGVTESPPGTTSSASTSSSTKQKRIAVVRTLHNYSLSPGKERKKSIEAKKKCKKLANALYKVERRCSSWRKKLHLYSKLQMT